MEEERPTPDRRFSRPMMPPTPTLSAQSSLSVDEDLDDDELLEEQVASVGGRGEPFLFGLFGFFGLPVWYPLVGRGGVGHLLVFRLLLAGRTRH